MTFLLGATRCCAPLRQFRYCSPSFYLIYASSDGCIGVYNTKVEKSNVLIPCEALLLHAPRNRTEYFPPAWEELPPFF